MNINNIFISYNPFSNDEKILAEGLYKKGRQNGFQLFIPERNNTLKLSNLTKSRIDDCNWFVVFCFGELSSVVRDEINYAFTQSKIKEENIIVVFSKQQGPKIQFDKVKPTIRFVDQYKLNNVENFSNDLLSEISNKAKTIKKHDDDFTALKVILGIGAAALLINALTSESK